MAFTKQEKFTQLELSAETHGLSSAEVVEWCRRMLRQIAAEEDHLLVVRYRRSNEAVVLRLQWDDSSCVFESYPSDSAACSAIAQFVVRKLGI